MQDFYSDFGIDSRVSEYCRAILAPLKDRFDAIDAVAEENQAKVLLAMQRNRVDAACFAGSTGYGYNDAGRDTLERVYADAFRTEAARVRPQLVCGTHALAVALREALRHAGGGHRHPACRLLPRGIRRRLPPGRSAPGRRL